MLAPRPAALSQFMSRRAPHPVSSPNGHVLAMALVAAAFALLGTACGTESPTCGVPGILQECPCTGGTIGVQACESSGVWGTCDCATAGADDVGSDGSRPGAGDASADIDTNTDTSADTSRDTGGGDTGTDDATGADTGSTDPDASDSGGADAASPCATTEDCRSALGDGAICADGACVFADDSSGGPADDPGIVWDDLDEGGAGDERLPWGAETGRFCGIPAYSNGPSSGGGYYSGSSIFGFRYQCTEFAWRFLCQHYDVLGCSTTGKNNRAYGNAKQWWRNELNHPVLAALERHANGGTEAPRPGDVIVFDGAVYGHVAIVRAVNADNITVIEQNVSGTANEANHAHRLDRSGGRYRVTGALGWMRPSGSTAACGLAMPSIAAPDDGAAFDLGNSVTLVWALGEPVAHTLKIRHIDSDEVVLEESIGSSTTRRFQPTRAGVYRWTVYFRDPACVDGQCAAPSRQFTVRDDGTTECSSNYCQLSGRTSGWHCDGNQRVQCGARGVCAVELDRRSCTGGAVCEAGACVEVGCLSRSDCPADVAGTWGSCDYSDTCDESATRRRSVTTYSCVSRNCVSATETQSEACTRDTDGTVVSSGSYGSCGGFSDTCDETGTQSRTNTVCRSGSASSASESRSCTRDTDGTVVSSGSWGSCGGFTSTCDETGTQSRTTTVCRSGSASSSSESRSCTRDTDGTSCSGGTCSSGSCVATGCPSGTGLYCGTGGRDPSTLYYCSGGSYSFDAYCAAGCITMPAGTNDACRSGSCPSGNGLYCGQSVGLSSRQLMRCTNGVYRVAENCATACVVAPAGTNDYCR